jgi:hypothetical protein
MKITITKIDESHITYDYEYGHSSRGRRRKRWMDCVKDDMKIKGVRIEMTSYRKEWKMKTCCADVT